MKEDSHNTLSSLTKLLMQSLGKAEKPLNQKHRATVARLVAEKALTDLPHGALERHIPLDIISLMEQGLISVPLAPEYELHRLTCDKCDQNYHYAKSHMGNVERIQDANPDIWQRMRRSGGLYKSRLLEALRSSSKIYVVSGEIIEDVFDEEMCEAIRTFAEEGNEFSMVAGPVIEKRNGESGSNHFFDLAANGETRNVNFYVADRRQNLHFAYSDTKGFIYLEAPHQSAIEERCYLFPETLEDNTYRSAMYAHYVRERFETSFSSPDVRLCRSIDDVILRDGTLLEKTGKLAEDAGLDVFGKYGLSALITLLDDEKL